MSQMNLSKLQSDIVTKLTGYTPKSDDELALFVKRLQDKGYLPKETCKFSVEFSNAYDYTGCDWEEFTVPSEPVMMSVPVYETVMKEVKRYSTKFVPNPHYDPEYVKQHKTNKKLVDVFNADGSLATKILYVEGTRVPLLDASGVPVREPLRRSVDCKSKGHNVVVEFVDYVPETRIVRYDLVPTGEMTKEIQDWKMTKLPVPTNVVVKDNGVKTVEYVVPLSKEILTDFAKQLDKIETKCSVNKLFTETFETVSKLMEPTELDHRYNLPPMNPHNLPPMVGRKNYEKRKKSNHTRGCVPGKGSFKSGKQVYVNTSRKHQRKNNRRAKWCSQEAGVVKRNATKYPVTKVEELDDVLDEEFTVQDDSYVRVNGDKNVVASSSDQSEPPAKRARMPDSDDEDVIPSAEEVGM